MSDLRHKCTDSSAYLKISIWARGALQFKLYYQLGLCITLGQFTMITVSCSCSCWNSLTVPLRTTIDDSAYTKPTPQWQDCCPPPYNHNPNVLPNPVNEDFPPFWTLTIPHHCCTILPKAPISPDATVTRAVWGGGKPGHISAFLGYACKTTAIGRRQPNRIHSDGFFI